MSASTGTRKERNVQSRSNEAITEADKEYIDSLKIFSESSNSTAGLAGGAVNNSPKTPAGNYLAREGDSMIGPLALGPPLNFRIEVDTNNTIDIGPLNDNRQYTSNIQLDDLQTDSSVLDIIANAAFDGQILILRTFAPTIPYTISQGTVGNGGNIQTGDSNDLSVGDLQTVVLVFDESLIVHANIGGTWRVMSISTGSSGGMNTDLSNMVSPTVPTVDLSMNGQSITNTLSVDIEDSAGATKLGISGPLGIGARFAFVAGDSVFFTENITDIIEIDSTGLKLLTNDITMGTGGNIIGGGATEGMTNIGHLDFVDNTATPAAALSIYSDGTDMLVNTGGGVVNLSNVGGGVFPDNTFRITGSVDATKRLAFEVDGFTTATTRTITMPDASTALVLDTLSNLNATTAVNVTLQAGNDGLTNLGSFSFHWDEIFGRTVIFKEDKPVDATETAIGASSTELWLNQTNAGRPIAFRWDDVLSYEFGRTIFKTQNPVLSWQLVNGATNTFSITDFATHMEFLNTDYDVFRFEGANHTRLDLTGIGFTTAGLNQDEILFDSSNSTANDIVGQIHYVGHTDGAANFDIAKIVAINEVPTNATRSGLLEFRLSDNGTENDLFMDMSGFFSKINMRKEVDMNNNKISDIGETTITDLTTVTGASGDFLMMVDATDGLMKKVNASDFIGGGSQTPWTSDIDADGFDLTDLSNIEFRDTTGVPPTNVGRIWQDSSGLNIGSAAATEEIGFFLGATEQIRIDEDAEFLFVQDNHKIVPQTTSLQFTVNSASHEFQFQCGTTSSNPNFIIEEERITLRTEDADTQAATIQLIQNNITPMNDRTIANIHFIAEDSTSVDTIYGLISATSIDINNGSEDGQLLFGVASGGSTLRVGFEIQGLVSGVDGVLLGFYGQAAVARQVLAANPTNAEISTVLEALGLTKFT